MQINTNHLAAGHLLRNLMNVSCRLTRSRQTVSRKQWSSQTRAVFFFFFFFFFFSLFFFSFLFFFFSFPSVFFSNYKRTLYITMLRQRRLVKLLFLSGVRRSDAVFVCFCFYHVSVFRTVVFLKLIPRRQFLTIS